MTAIRVSNVYKIFGPTMTHARVIDMLRHGASKAEALPEKRKGRRSLGGLLGLERV